MIPEMTDPLGRHWQQPADIRDAPIDSTTILLNPVQFARLLNYSASEPSGVYAGKCWKREYEGGWLLGFYSEHVGKPGWFRVKFRKILVVE